MEIIKRIFIGGLFGVWGLVLFQIGAPVYAMDPEGCLFCHQYPGLVTSNENHVDKILHIDETRYRSSAHGRLACRSCHAVVDRVPHTGSTQVNCFRDCHQKPEDKERIEAYPLREFHRQEQSAIIALEDGSSCRACHHLYPHSLDNRVRALLNLHTGFMMCEVCHLGRESHPGSFYDWNGAELARFSGKPYGTFYNPRLKKAGKSKNYLSRISVFVTRNGEKRSLANTADRAAAEAYLRERSSLSPGLRKERLIFFHRDVRRNEIASACDACHSMDSILDFQRLGFDPVTAHNLKTLNIKGLVTKYKTFYFPRLF